MLILVIPVVFALVMGLACMGPAGWVALACGLEFFGWITKPRRRCPRPQAISKPVGIFVVVFLVFGFSYLIAATTTEPRDERFGNGVVVGTLRHNGTFAVLDGCAAGTTR